MTSSASFLPRFGSIWISACLLVLVPAWAQETSAPASRPAVSDQPLNIVNGKFTSDGKSVPATVKNLVELIRQRYRSANITVVDVDDVVVDHLTLHWARTRRVSDGGAVVFDDPPLAAVLAALSMASGEKFTPVNFGPSENFVLRKWGENNRGPSAQQTEVFNLSPFLTQGSRRAANLEEELRQLQFELTVQQKRYAEKHPSIVELTNRIEAVKAVLAEVNKSAGDVKEASVKLLNQIEDVVRSTLALQNTNEKPPEFQFHPGSNLLIVIGSDTSVNITRKVIAALEQNH